MSYVPKLISPNIPIEAPVVLHTVQATALPHPDIDISVSNLINPQQEKSKRTIIRLLYALFRIKIQG
jgi:hypothetical protein